MIAFDGMRRVVAHVGLLALGALCGACAVAPGAAPTPAAAIPSAAATSAPRLVAIPANKDSDFKLYRADGTLLTGPEALARMPEADVVAWLAGNQFFAMDAVMAAFRKQHPGLSVGLVTLPPGCCSKRSRKAAGPTAASRTPAGPMSTRR